MDRQERSSRPRETRSESVHNWVTSFAFVLAGAWGIYTFWHTQIEAPRSAPVNVTTEVQLRVAGRVDEAPAPTLVAVEATITASNPSPRAVHLLPGYWLAYGTDVSAADNREWTEALALSIDRRSSGVTGGRYYHASPERLVAGGPAFVDTVLQPNERVSRSVIFYIPEHRFNLLRVRAVLPSADKSEALDVDYAYDETGLVRSVMLLGEDDTRTEITTEQANAMYGMQWSISERQLAVVSP